jgi:hypothetical protein
MDSRILCLAIVLDKNRPSRRIASMQKMSGYRRSRRSKLFEPAEPRTGALRRY